MIAVTVRDEGELRAVGRPGQRAIIAAVEEQPLRLALAVERRRPHLIVFEEGELAAREIAGPSPSATLTGAPPESCAAQMVTLGSCGEDDGSGGSFASQFAS